MKEAFWGVLIVILGLLGIVILQLFQNITVTNDQTYYLLKETTEAAMYDAIDLAYYRTKGKIRIVEDKFVENLTRRFAESATLNREYNIVVHEINEEPPRVSLSIGTYVFSLRGNTFNIGQSIDAIIESKFDKEDKDEEVEVVEPTPAKGECPVCIPGKDPNCNAISQCIIGDLEFVGWEDVNIPEKICEGDPTSPKKRNAIYKSCECGNWVEKKEELTANPVVKTDRVEYTWRFQKSSPIRDLDVSTTKKSYYDVCTTGIDCPNGKITLVKGQTHRIVPKYIPENAVNRDLTWTSSDTSIATVIDAVKAPEYPGTDDATVKASSTKTGTAIITATTTNGKSDSCTVEVIDNIVECPTTPIEIKAGEEGTLRLNNNVTFPNMKFSISNTTIAELLDSNTGRIKIANNISSTTMRYDVEVEISGNKYKAKDCELKINGTQQSSGCTVGQIKVDWNYKSLPTLCPQELGSNSSDYLAALNMNATPAFCGKSGNFVNCNSGKWENGASQNFNSNMPNSITESPKKSITVLRTGNNYRITWYMTYRYDEWNRTPSDPYSCPYMKERNPITLSYSLTGKLLDEKTGVKPDGTRCDSLEYVSLKRDIDIDGCPKEVYAGSQGTVTINAMFSPEIEFNASTISWKKEGSGSISSTKGQSIKYTPPKNVSEIERVTIYFTIKDIEGMTYGDSKEAVCTFDLKPFEDCTRYKIRGDQGKICVGTKDTYKLWYTNDSGIAEAYNSNALWDVRSGAIFVTPYSSPTYLLSMTLKGTAKGEFILVANKQIGDDECKVEQKFTVEKGIPTCNDSGYPNLSGGKCYNTKSSRTPICNDGYYTVRSGSKCYNSTKEKELSCGYGYDRKGEKCVRFKEYQYADKICKGEEIRPGKCVDEIGKVIGYTCPSDYSTYAGGNDCRKAVYEEKELGCEAGLYEKISGSCYPTNDTKTAKCSKDYILVGNLCRPAIDAEYSCAK
jgi:hypothetical protein